MLCVCDKYHVIISMSVGRAYIEAIRDYGSVRRAWEGVSLDDPASYRAVVRSAGRLPYKATNAHWTNFNEKIFRDPYKSPRSKGKTHRPI